MHYAASQRKPTVDCWRIIYRRNPNFSLLARQLYLHSLASIHSASSVRMKKAPTDQINETAILFEELTALWSWASTNTRISLNVVLKEVHSYPTWHEVGILNYKHTTQFFQLIEWKLWYNEQPEIELITLQLWTECVTIHKSSRLKYTFLRIQCRYYQVLSSQLGE